MKYLYGLCYFKNTEECLNTIPSDQILEKYFGEFEVDQYYFSPFREEKNRSFVITYYNDRYVWRDFGLSPYPENAINFVMELYGIPYYEALETIADDFINYATDFPKEKKKKHKIVKKPSIVNITLNQDFEEIALEYWNKYKITKNHLIYYNIYNCELWVNGIRLFYYNKYKLSFCYLFDLLSETWKAYNPFASDSELKFYSNNISNHIQNWSNLKKFNKKDKDLVFVVKSYKDSIVMNILGYDAIAPHSENEFINEDKLSYIQSEYPNTEIIIFYDNDIIGLKNAKKFSNNYQIPYVHLPLELLDNNVKDPSDYVEKYSYEDLQIQLDEMLLNKEIYDNNSV